jgi:sigma-B regulation protein RsbU (phosphoserine phosphatase)
VADVCGHGVPAAMAATLLKAFVSEAAKRTSSPAEILTEVNQRYCEYVMIGHFATMTLVVIDAIKKRLVYANAGHELPILQHGRDAPRRMDIGDLPLGVEDDTIYAEEEVHLGSNARVVIVSDGVTEAFNPDGDQYGTGRIEVLMRKNGSTDARGLVEAIAASLEEFRNGRVAFDDTTLLVAQLS